MNGRSIWLPKGSRSMACGPAAEGNKKTPAAKRQEQQRSMPEQQAERRRVEANPRQLEPNHNPLAQASTQHPTHYRCTLPQLSTAIADQDYSHSRSLNCGCSGSYSHRRNWKPHDTTASRDCSHSHSHSRLADWCQTLPWSVRVLRVWPRGHTGRVERGDPARTTVECTGAPPIWDPSISLRLMCQPISP